MGNVAGGMGNIGNMAMNDVNRQIPRNAMAPMALRYNSRMATWVLIRHKIHRISNNSSNNSSNSRRVVSKCHKLNNSKFQHLLSNQVIPVGQQQQAAKTSNIQDHIAGSTSQVQL